MALKKKKKRPIETGGGAPSVGTSDPSAVPALKKRRHSENGRDASLAEARPPAVVAESITPKSGKKKKQRSHGPSEKLGEAPAGGISSAVTPAVPQNVKDTEEVPLKRVIIPRNIKDPEKERLAMRAMEEIHEALETHQGALLNCPKFWHSKYRSPLGKFKKFIKRQAHAFSIHDNKDTSFWVMKAGAGTPNCVGIAEHEPNSWQKMLYKAWCAYVAAAPTGQRSLISFMRPLGSVSNGVGRETPQAASAGTVAPVKRKKVKKLKKKVQAAG